MAKSKNSDFKDPLAKVKGLGAAGHGSGHWMHQRITALANIPLVIWLVISILSLRNADYNEFTQWLAAPFNAILMILVIISVFYHAALGSQVIIEDYISCKCFRMFKLIGTKLFFFFAAVSCIFSILKIAFTVGV